MKKQTLPVATYNKGKWVLSEPYEYSNRITCKPYGEMSDGTMVWQDKNEKQYIRMKFFGKYFFCPI